MAGIIRPELYQQNAPALGKQFKIRRTLLSKTVDHRSFKTLEGDRSKFQDLWNVIGCRKRVLVTKPNESPVLRTLNQRKLCLQNDRACALGPDQSTRHIESSFRK